jgi:UbiD family decarboxylase
MKNPTPCSIVEIKRESIELDLNEIPVLTHYQGEQGPYITSALVYARDPDGEGGNVSYHRMDVIGEKRLSICIQPGHLKEYIQKVNESGGNSLDISISIGNHPAVMLAASLRPPVNVSEYDVANTLLRGRLELFQCPNVDALAPVEAELVLEGRILVKEEATEGPYVCVTGTMKESKPMPVVEIVGVIRKDDYIYQGLLGGSIEHRLLESIPNEVKLWKQAKEAGYDVKGIHMTSEGSSWLHCVVSITKKSNEDPENLLREMFKTVPALKHAIVVDEDVNPYDMREVEWALSTRFQADKDLIMLSNTYASRLDPSSDLENKRGCKLGIDATIPMGKPRTGFVKGIIPSSKRVRKAIKS